MPNAPVTPTNHKPSNQITNNIPIKLLKLDLPNKSSRIFSNYTNQMKKERFEWIIREKVEGVTRAREWEL